MVNFKVIGSEEHYGGLSVLRPGFVDLMFEIMYTRFNHSVEVILTESEFSEEINGTWTGLIGVLVRGEADLSMVGQIYDAQIAEVVGSQYMSYVETIGILAKEKTVESLVDVMRIFYDTELKVWILMFLVMLTMTIFNKITTILISKPEENLNIMHDNNLLTLFELLLYCGSSRVPKHICTRILLQFYLFSTMTFVCFYYASMKTSVTMIRPTFYKTIEDLLQDDHVTLQLMNARSISTMLKNSQNEEYRQLWKRVSTPPGKIVEDIMKFVVDSRHRQSFAQQVDKMNHVCVGEISTMNIFTNVMCPFFNKDVVLVKHNLRGLLHFYLLKKNLEWEKKLHLKKITRLLIDTGVILHLFNRNLQGEIPLCARKSGEPTEVQMESLMLASLSNVAVVWIIGILVSVVCFVAEIFFKNFTLFPLLPITNVGKILSR